VTTARDTRLAQFFSGYFHQDWDLAAANGWKDVIAQFIRDTPRGTAAVIHNDLLAWLNENPRGTNLPVSFGCEYDPRPDGLDDWHWVKQIAQYLAQAVTNVGPS
jgi:hypothetical protein